tara:strand:+ start:1 stop:1986 length:1986 start_codon:yes stop_codon:yes gene_type:complete
MNLTKDKVKLVGYTFAFTLLIPPNIGFNLIGINLEDLPLIFLFFYLSYIRINKIRNNGYNKLDSYFSIFFVVFILYTSLITKSIEIFNQTNLRFYFYFSLSYLVVTYLEKERKNIVNIFSPLFIVMYANLIVVILQINIYGNLNGWISNNTGGSNPFNSGRLGGFQGGGPNVIGIFCAISSLFYLYKIINERNLKKSFYSNFFSYSIFLISIFNLYLTYSRGSYLAFGVGIIAILYSSNKINIQRKTLVILGLLVFSFISIYLNPSIFLKQSNRGFLTNLAIANLEIYKGTGGGNYIKEVYKEYLVTLDESDLVSNFNVVYSDKEKNESSKLTFDSENIETSGYLKLKFDYRDRNLPRSNVSFFFSNNGIDWEQIGFDHSNGEVINLIENDSYFEVGGWGDGQSSDGSFLDGNIKEVTIKSGDNTYIYKFPRYKRGVDYFLLTPKLRNIYRGDINFTETGILLDRPRDYWLALPNYINLSNKDFEVIVHLDIDGIPKGNETLFSQSSILRLNEEFNDQSWKWSIVDGRMYFFWIENVDNGYVNYLGGKSLRSGKLVSYNSQFGTSNIPEFDISQYDEITTSHNGFLTMSVEYGVIPVSLLILLSIYLVIKNMNKKFELELTIFLMLFLQNITNDLVYSPDVGIYFWLIPIYFAANILIVDN